MFRHQAFPIHKRIYKPILGAKGPRLPQADSKDWQNCA